MHASGTAATSTVSRWETTHLALAKRKLRAYKDHYLERADARGGQNKFHRLARKVLRAHTERSDADGRDAERRDRRSESEAAHHRANQRCVVQRTQAGT